MDRLRALMLLLRLGKMGAVQREEPAALSAGDCTIYAASGASCGTVLMFHGMSPRADQDPRWVQLARGFARAGLTVYAPRLPSVAALRMEVAQIDVFEAWIAAVSDAVGGRVGLFSVSFSGGIALLAAARASVRERISAVCVLGAFGDVRETLRYVLTDPDSDPYGRLIVLGNFAARAIADPEGWLERALLSRAEDNFHSRSPRMSPADLPPPLSGHLAALLDDPAARVRCWEGVEASGLPEIDGLEVLCRVGGLCAPVTLIHGEGDRVIPAAQSVQLRAAIDAVGLPVELVVTPLISHGDTQVSLVTTLRHAPALTAGFGAFIGRARAG